MTSLEAQLRSRPAKFEEFQADCESVFAGKEGQRLIATLCELAHPLDHSPMPQESLLVDRGRKEFTALLWRYGYADLKTYPPMPNQDTRLEDTRHKT